MSLDFNALWNMDLENIFKLTDEHDFSVAVSGYLCRKSNNGDNIGALSEAERTVFVVISLENEVNNGGFSQFFYNSSGDFANEAADRLRAIGAEKMAAICEKAVGAAGVRLPEDRNKREDILDELPEEFEDILDECDSEFYDYPDKLSELIFSFAKNNREHFT